MARSQISTEYFVGVLVDVICISTASFPMLLVAVLC